MDVNLLSCVSLNIKGQGSDHEKDLLYISQPFTSGVMVAFPCEKFLGHDSVCVGALAAANSTKGLCYVSYSRILL